MSEDINSNSKGEVRTFANMSSEEYDEKEQSPGEDLLDDVFYVKKLDDREELLQDGDEYDDDDFSLSYDPDEEDGDEDEEEEEFADEVPPEERPLEELSDEELLKIAGMEGVGPDSGGPGEFFQVLPEPEEFEQHAVEALLPEIEVEMCHMMGVNPYADPNTMFEDERNEYLRRRQNIRENAVAQAANLAKVKRGEYESHMSSQVQSHPWSREMGLVMGAIPQNSKVKPLTPAQAEVIVAHFMNQMRQSEAGRAKKALNGRKKGRRKKAFVETRNRRSRGGSTLSEGERAVCRKLGIAEKTFLKYRSRNR